MHNFYLPSVNLTEGVSSVLLFVYSSSELLLLLHFF